MALYSNSLGYPFPEQKSGLHSNVFLPPRTPSSTHVDPIAFAATPSQDKPLLTRKRTRTNSVKANTSATLTHASKDGWNPRSTSPAPLANTRYTLAGGFDTPTLAATRDDTDDLTGERNFRWKWDSGNLSPEQEPVAGPLARERNGKARVISVASDDEPAQSNGWGRFVLNLVGGVAGKMWHFCRGNAFSGFYAGAGQGFEFNQPSQLPTPLPGQYPSPDFFGDFDQDYTPIHSAKRQHTESGNGWVMVDRNQERPQLSVRKTSSGSLSRIGATSASSRRPGMRRLPSRQVSYTGSPLPNPRLDVFDQAFAGPASTAPTRFGAPARSPVAVHHRSPLTSPQRASFGNPRPSSAAGNDSPLSPEAAQYLLRMERQDRDADKSMRKMSRQVQDLIRQGQAALGTKFEVEDFDDADVDDWEDAKRS